METNKCPEDDTSLHHVNVTFQVPVTFTKKAAKALTLSEETQV